MSDAKRELRREAVERRALAFAANPLAGETAAILFPAGLVRPGIVVAGYARVRTEIDPLPLMKRLAALGAATALPVTPPKGEARPLEFRRWSPGEPLVEGEFGVPEPLAAARTLQPDIVLTPLLAFDRSGARTGYGAGFYDRTLARLRAVREVLAVGLAYAAQEVEAAHAEPHDVPLDAILTERAYIPLNSKAMDRA